MEARIIENGVLAYHSGTYEIDIWTDCRFGPVEVELAKLIDALQQDTETDPPAE